MNYLFLFTAVMAGPPNLLWTSIPSGGITAVETAGDVNGDGTEDVFAAWYESAYSGAACLSGINGALIWVSSSVMGAENRLCLKAVPDIDGDGIMDLAAGTEADSSVTVLSGADGTLVWSEKRSAPVRAVEFSSGPGGEVVVLGNSVADAELWCSFFGLAGSNGAELWAASPQSSDDFYIRTTQDDLSGNGWSEMAYSIDRGSAYTGYVDVRDGYSGNLLQSSATMYFPSVDVSDSPGYMAVSHYGYPPDLWAEGVATGTIQWSIDDLNLCGNEMLFVQNVDDPEYPCPDLLSWYSNKLVLIRGDDGLQGNWYDFPAFIVISESYPEEDQWRLAVVTVNSFNCPYLSYEAAGSGPEVPLPGTAPGDMCLLQSDDYPTPFAVISMEGSGPGVCCIATSWPQGTEEQSRISMQSTSGILPVQSPSSGGIRIAAEADTSIRILDIAGRTVGQRNLHWGEEAFIQLPPGLYIVAEGNSAAPACRAVVTR